MWFVRVAFVVAIMAAAPGSDAPLPPSSAAKEYFEHAAELIRQHHRNSATVVWAEVVKRALPMLAGATRPDDTYPAIRVVLAELGERHSFLLPAPDVPEGRGTFVSNTGAEQGVSPTWRIVAGNIGELSLPGLNTLGPNGQALGASYTAAARKGLSAMDRASHCGWIIDLRDNGGGNMWPMLGGLDPLLGTGPFGFFVRPDGSREAWLRSGGHIYPSSETLPGSSPAFSLANASAPVAVLIGPRTASSGEMVAIALIGRDDVRVFGAASAGLTTGNTDYRLSDGAMLLITEVSVRDRTVKDYSGPVVPDEQVDPSRVEAAASRWLEGRCRPALRS